MQALQKRREEDIQRIKALSDTYQDRVQLMSCDKALSSIKVRLGIPTALDCTYPATVQPQSEIEIILSQRYPFQEPTVIVRTPVWSPNIFPGGQICLGTRWIGTEGLDLLVERVMRLLAFEPHIVNTSSPANKEACAWYIRARATHPAAFPSVSIDGLRRRVPKPRIVWSQGSPSIPWREV